MKKILKVTAFGCLLAATAQAQSSTPIMRFLPFFTGYNVSVPTNTVAGIGVTNLLFSNPQGQNVYSLTNQVVNGVLNTNVTTGDAFQQISLRPDDAGDMVANAAVIIYVNNTNLIPVAVTNSFGQYFVTNWPLAVEQFPNWMYPATTNVFPLVDLTDTNLVTVSLYRVSDIRGGFGGQLAPSTPQMVETTAAFSFSFNPTSTTNQVVITNLPVAWMQGVRSVRATITVGANAGASGAGNNASGILINQMGILQPQP